MKHTATIGLFFLALSTPLGCASPESGSDDRRSHQSRPAVVRSLLGDSLAPPALTSERRAKLEADLAAAEVAWKANPRDETAAIWRGRRLAYLFRYHDSIAAFSQGLRHKPESFRLLRHRGHRFITIRQFDLAIDDLTRAAELASGVEDEIEPDGAPNASGVPRSTTKFNIHYHLALSHYLKHDFEAARRAWEECMNHSRSNDDKIVATTYWWYLTNRRLGRHEEAARLLDAIHTKMEVLEDHAYYALLLMFKGERTPEQLLAAKSEDGYDRAALLYGIGAWSLVNGRPDQAESQFRELVADSMWPAFGYIAAEAELARWPSGSR